MDTGRHGTAGIGRRDNPWYPRWAGDPEVATALAKAGSDTDADVRAYARRAGIMTLSAHD